MKPAVLAEQRSVGQSGGSRVALWRHALGNVLKRRRLEDGSQSRQRDLLFAPVARLAWRKNTLPLTQLRGFPEDQAGFVGKVDAKRGAIG